MLRVGLLLRCSWCVVLLCVVCWLVLFCVVVVLLCCPVVAACCFVVVCCFVVFWCVLCVALLYYRFVVLLFCCCVGVLFCRIVVSLVCWIVVFGVFVVLVCVQELVNCTHVDEQEPFKPLLCVDLVVMVDTNFFFHARSRNQRGASVSRNKRSGANKRVRRW